MCLALPSIGFLGLGVEGLPMAKQLCDAGYSVTVYSRTPGLVKQAEAFGAYAGESPRRLGERCDVLITMLADPETVRDMIDGSDDDGALSHPKKGLIWIQMSTLDKQSTNAYHKDAELHGVTFLDAQPGSIGARTALKLLGGEGLAAVLPEQNGG